MKLLIAAAVSKPEANKRGSSLISRRLHYRGLQTLFLTKCKGLWLCANGRFRMRSGMQRSKLTFLKSRLLATFNCKMVAIKKKSVAKNKTT